jgi:hypothetical protein
MNNVLYAAHQAWSNAADFRTRRERQKHYTYGDQWCDIVADHDDNLMREDALIRQSGRKPLTNNLIRQLIKTVVGRYRTMTAEAATYSNAPDSYAYLNRLAELDSRALEEFLISGCAVQRVVYERRMQGTGVWIDNVDPRRFFVNAITDVRGWDMELVGMLHDMSLPEVICRFGRGRSDRAAELTRLYSNADNSAAFSLQILGTATDEGRDFFTASSGKCRVIEVWTLDCAEMLSCIDRESNRQFDVATDKRDAIAAENERRKKTERQLIDVRNDFRFAWHCRWLAPDGTVLDEYDSPYPHGQHPFVVKLYPLTDGEVHSFVEDVIDQQRYINRLIVMIDHMMASSAKGVLLFPVEQLPKGMEWEQVAKTWAHSDGIIPITGRSDVLPQQVVTPTANSGAYQLLSLQMKLFEDISGVSDALLGRNVSSTTGASLYESQVRNATVALTDLLESFISFTTERNSKAENCR